MPDSNRPAMPSSVSVHRDAPRGGVSQGEVSQGGVPQRDVFRLGDGRRMRVVETGPADGLPVVYCHGAIGTPLESSVSLDALTRELGVRHIAIDRPGTGGSDRSPGRTLGDFAADVGEIVDQLGLGMFSVAGVSAGGPYALAIARELPDRVTRVALCSSLSPLCRLDLTPGLKRRVRLALGLLARAPRTLAAIGDAGLPLIRCRPGLLSAVIAMHAAPSERDLLHAADHRAAATDSFLAATAAGVGGLIEDYLVYTGPWSFKPSDVAAEVQLWHGFADPLVPVDHALHLAAALPHCRVFLDSDEGHHFFRRRLAEILGVLVGRCPEPAESVRPVGRLAGR
jgi:pimeloyl-ACP methyl ester carboxylesterase